MITKVNNDNANAYKSLFLKADQELGFSEDNGVASLDEYFQWIKELGNEDLKYVVLPLDEPAFEINANSRLITVPSEFRSNGLSVQGDEGAEIVYFKIDRYFDATDFGADDTKIIIQWETAPDVAGQATAGTSNALIRDIESEPGKLIFGWYLDDTITQNPGEIKFAVRIYKLNANREIVYNFSTLTAVGSIKPSLDLNLAQYYLNDEPETWIKSRLIDSPKTEGTSVANAPIFIMNLIPWEGENAGRVELDANGTKTLSVETKTGDAGVIGYDWKKWDVADVDQSGAFTNLVSNKIYKATANEVFAQDIIYYIKEEKNGAVSYMPIANSKYSVGDNIAEWCTAQTNAGNAIIKENVCECFSDCVVNSVGFYKVTAQNRVGKSIKETDSFVALVPGPVSDAEFSIAPATENVGAININDAAHGGMAHAFFEEITEGEGEDEVTRIVVVPKVAVNHDVHNTTTFAWTKDGIDANVNADHVSVEVSEADRKNYNSVFEVSVFDTRNGLSTTDESIDGAPRTVKIRVTDYAQEIPMSQATNSDGEYSGLYTGQTIDLDDYLNKAAVYCGDEIQYQWYIQNGQIKGDDDTPVSGQTSAEFVPTQANSYFCKVVNCIKDGNTVVSSKEFFTPTFVVKNA